MLQDGLPVPVKTQAGDETKDPEDVESQWIGQKLKATGAIEYGLL